MRITLGYLLTFGWVFLVLGLTLLLKRATRADDEISRKIVHISVAFAWIPMYFFFGVSRHLLVPPAVFAVLNAVSYKKNLFAAMERRDESRKSPGTIYYAVSMLLMSAATLLRPSLLLPYGMGLFCMALGDGFAPIFGALRRGNRRLFAGRTLYGTLSVFCICLLVIGVFSAIFALPLSLPQMLLLALTAAVCELVGVRGLDNLTLPLGVFALSGLLLA